MTESKLFSTGNILNSSFQHPQFSLYSLLQSPSKPTTSTTPDKDTFVTVKLFLESKDKEVFKDALLKCNSWKVDQFILSFNGISFSDEEDEGESEWSNEEILELWNIATSHVKAESYGVSEFSSDKLRSLVDRMVSTPQVDHINAADCCALPESLITFAKERNIRLLAHHDPETLLTQDEVDKLSKNPGKCSWRWALKVTRVARDRQILISNEFFVSISA